MRVECGVGMFPGEAGARGEMTWYLAWTKTPDMSNPEKKLTTTNRRFANTETGMKNLTQRTQSIRKVHKELLNSPEPLAFFLASLRLFFSVYSVISVVFPFVSQYFYMRWPCPVGGLAEKPTALEHRRARPAKAGLVWLDCGSFHRAPCAVAFSIYTPCRGCFLAQGGPGGIPAGPGGLRKTARKGAPPYIIEKVDNYRLFRLSFMNEKIYRHSGVFRYRHWQGFFVSGRRFS
jgi:hypothetical protein